MELQNCFSQGRCCFIQTKVALKTPEFFPIIKGNSFIAVESSHRQRFSRSSWALMDWEVISHDDEATTKIIGRSQGKKPYLSQGLKFNFQPILLYKKIEQNELMMTHRFAFRDKKGKTASNYPTLRSVGMLHNVKIYQILALLFSKPTRKQFMYYVKFQTLTHRLRNVRIMQHRHTTERITKQLPEHHS